MIDQHLNSARLIHLPVSADCLASDYCNDVEMKRALELHKEGEAQVVPIILKPSAWRQSSLADLQWLPKDAEPITLSSNRKAAFSSIPEERGRLRRG